MQSTAIVTEGLNYQFWVSDENLYCSPFCLKLKRLFWEKVFYSHNFSMTTKSVQHIFLRKLGQMSAELGSLCLWSCLFNLSFAIWTRRKCTSRKGQRVEKTKRCIYIQFIVEGPKYFVVLSSCSVIIADPCDHDVSVCDIHSSVLCHTVLHKAEL